MAETSESLTFCTSFLSLRSFVERHEGPRAFNQVRDRLTAEHDLTLPPVLVAGQWYPTLAFCRGMDVAKELSGLDNFYARFGSAACEIELKILFRFALRLASPKWMLRAGAASWSKVHTTGHWKIEGSKNSMRGTLRDFGVVHFGQCQSLTAWFQRAAQMTGELHAKVRHPECRAAGSSACVFEITW